MLAEALEAEIDSFLEGYRGIVDEEGRRQVARNGYRPIATSSPVPALCA
jgi:hypothetical protein